MKVKVLRLVSDHFEHADLSNSKILVGRSPSCDLVIDHESVSHYHAMIFQDENGNLAIQDLQSTNGTFINGQKLNSLTFVSENDNLSFGKVHSMLIDTLEESELIDVEQQTAKEEIQEKIYIPEKAKESEVLIDDEYCDIIFNDAGFSPLKSSPIQNIVFDKENYIGTDDIDESFEIVEQRTGRCVQVTTLLSGNILEQYYLPLEDMSYTASGSSKKGHLLIDVLDDNTYSFLEIQGQNVSVSNLDGFEQNNNLLQTSDDATVIVLTQGTFQIMVEMSEVPDHLINIPRFVREQNFFKEAGKIVAGIMLPMLLLLLVDFAPEKKKPLKTLSIIYKKPTKSNIDGKKLASKNPNNEKKNNGHKSTKQPEKKIAHKKAGQKSKQAPAKKVAKASPKQAPKTKKSKAPIKAYQFKMASNVSNMFNSGKTVKVAQNRAPASVSANSAVTGDLNTKVAGTASAKVGNMGSDLAGAQASFGSQGLSSKKGIDSSYIQTKTVVLGSMDPELLRKILQRYLPQFRHCYQQELTYNSEDIKGIVDLNFVISGSGKVGSIDIKAKDNRFSKKGIDCMGNVLSIIDFPKPKGGGRVAVRQPLNFFSEQEKS
jgi:outer membrane biosynthesis protein TonB